MKKTFIALLVISLLGIASTYASETEDSENHPMMMNGSWAMMKHKEEIKEMRKWARDEMKANREEMKNNREEFRSEHKDDMKALSWSLTEEQKTSLKGLRDTHKAEMDSLMAELKTVKGDDAKMKEVFVKIESARAAHLDQVKAIVGENSEMAKIVDARKGVFEENKALREENRSKREELRAGIEDKVVKYKGAFVQKIAKKLEKFTPEQIQKIIDKVDAQLTKVEANTKLSIENKDKIKAQLVALRETLEDRLDTSDTQNDMAEVEAMIEAVTE